MGMIYADIRFIPESAHPLTIINYVTPGPASQALGLLTERWFFFAQAQHPQNIYDQVVS